MIKVDISNVWGQLSLPDLLATEKEVFNAHQTLTEGSGEGNDFLGWLNLPVAEETEEIRRIRAAAKQIRETSDVFVVIGIGGSYLGPRAAIELLQGANHNIGKGKGNPQIFYAGNGLSTRGCGNAWRFDACITLPDCSRRENNYYSDGCIAIDINSDRIAAVELDKDGCPRSREVIPLKLEGSTGQNGQEISRALERVFQACMDKHKPLAAEDIGATKRKAGRYSAGQKKNRSISMFASKKIRELTESKSFKYGTGVTFVWPSYTTQIGKVKYMKHYGLSIHESAALAIGRRAMGYTERLPVHYYNSLTDKQKARPRNQQWKTAYKRMSEVTCKQVLTGKIIPA